MPSQSVVAGVLHSDVFLTGWNISKKINGEQYLTLLNKATLDSIQGKVIIKVGIGKTSTKSVFTPNVESPTDFPLEITLQGLSDQRQNYLYKK